MLKIKSTGNKTVDKMIRTEFSGNVIPHTWFKTLAKENGKPYLNAMVLLSDIVFWYRPTEIIDEKTNSFKGYAKRFKGDILQRSYQQIEEKFGLSRHQAGNAIVFLEEKGVIKRVFRTITAQELKLSNVMFIDLNFEKLMEITFPKIEDEDKNEPTVDEENKNESDENTDSEMTQRQTEMMDFFFDKTESKNEKTVGDKPIMNKPNTCPEISDDPPINKFTKRVIRNLQRGSSEIYKDKYIDYNTKITNIDYNLSILSNNKVNDGLDMIDNLRQEYCNYFEENLELPILRENHPYDAEKINEIKNLLVDVCLQRNCKVNINGYPTSVEIVKSRFMDLKTQHVEYMLEALKKNTTQIRNIRSYLLTTIYNAPATYENYYSSETNHMLYGYTLKN